MPVSRRNFLGSAAAMGLLTTMLTPEQVSALQDTKNNGSQDAKDSGPSEEEMPHDSPAFWGGFYDVVDPTSPEYGKKSGTRGSESLADPKLDAQYLHFKPEEKRLRYATTIEKTELLDHSGDVAVSILMNQFRPSVEDAKRRSASQLRVDATQNSPFMNLMSPLAWSSTASLKPDKSGGVPSLETLGFQSDSVIHSSSHILLTKGGGRMAVNVSQAAKNSMFMKVLGAMIDAGKMIAPLVSLPAVSVTAMSAFSQAFSFWENRTQFLINGNLVNAYATKQAMDDPEIKSPAIGLIPGDYIVVAKKDTEKLQAALPQLHIFQGYLVHQDTDLNQPSYKYLADSRIPDITYATVKVGVKPLSSYIGG
jgi:hypothetical protein